MLRGSSFLALALFSPALFWFWGGMGVFSQSAALYAMRLPLWLLTLFAISQPWLAYARLASAAWRPFLRVAVNLGGLAFGIFLLRAGDLLVPGTNWDPSRYGSSLATLEWSRGV